MEYELFLSQGQPRLKFAVSQHLGLLDTTMFKSIRISRQRHMKSMEYKKMSRGHRVKVESTGNQSESDLLAMSLSEVGSRVCVHEDELVWILDTDLSRMRESAHSKAEEAYPRSKEALTGRFLPRILQI